MDIETIQNQLREEGVFSKVEELTEAATDVQDDCTWITERILAAHKRYAAGRFRDEQFTMEEKEYLRCLKEAYDAMMTLVDTLDDARRDLGWAMQKMNERPPGEDPKPLPRDVYERPIVDVLTEMGGSGRARDVLDRVGELMMSRLPAADLVSLRSSGEPRWRKMAQWAKYEMVLKGVLRSDSPRGTWELSEYGSEKASG